MDTACLFFGIGTVLCALSRGIYWLIAARAFAGVSGNPPLPRSFITIIRGEVRLMRSLGSDSLEEGVC